MEDIVNEPDMLKTIGTTAEKVDVNIGMDLLVETAALKTREWNSFCVSFKGTLNMVK